MSTNMNLLRGKLKERGVTQQELAQKIGMDSSTLSRKLAYYLRKELDKGTIPHIKSGRCIMINVPALLVQLGVPQK